MLDDDAEYEQRRQIRAQADADVAAFIESLGQDEGSGVPPPPTIKVSEVSSQPVELDFIGFGQQGSGTAPGAGSTPGSAPTGPCCIEDACSILTEAACNDAGGIYQGNSLTCEDVFSCCSKITFDGISFCECLFIDAFSLWYTFGSPETLNELHATIPRTACSGSPACETSFDGSPFVHGINYFAEPCTPDNLNDEFDVRLSAYVARISGVYHVLVTSAHPDEFGPPELIFFYGTTTDRGTPASNEVTCDGGDGSTWDNPLVNCVFGGPTTLIGAASGGTASLSVTP